MYHDDLRRVRSLLYFIDVCLDLSYQLHILLIFEIVLVQDYQAKAFGVRGQANKRFQRLKKLEVTVGSNANEYLVIFGDWV